jgi:hypothetical protein
MPKNYVESLPKFNGVIETSMEYPIGTFQYCTHNLAIEEEDVSIRLFVQGCKKMVQKFAYRFNRQLVSPSYYFHK